jgi:Flp pilus assembly protein TadD
VPSIGPVSIPRSASGIRGVSGARSLDAPARGGGRGLVIDNARSRAAALFDQSVREVKNGSFEKARGLCEQAAAMAPQEERYQDALRDWPAFVEAHKTPPDQRALAQAVLAEEAGDLVRATTLLRQATQANPANATAWNRLGLVLARQKDTRGAAAALGKAVELSPEDAGILSNFAKVAGAAEKAGGLEGGLRSLWKRIVR